MLGPPSLFRAREGGLWTSIAQFTSFFDLSKAKHAAAIAESDRIGEVRYFGEIEATPAAVERFVRKLGKKHRRLNVCYEPG